MKKNDWILTLNGIGQIKEVFDTSCSVQYHKYDTTIISKTNIMKILTKETHPELFL